MSRVLGMLLLLCSCGRVVDGTKDALNKGGELAGSAATEVIEGVTTGVEKTWAVEVDLSEDLRARGLGVGRFMVETDSSGTANRLVLYLSADRSFSDTIQATARDADGVEMGRASLLLALPAGAADYHVLRFQSRTDLERKSRVELR